MQAPRRGAAKTFAAADLYPLEPGWKWAYDVVKDGQTMLALYAVLDRTGESATVQAGDEQLGYAVTPEGIAQKDGPVVGDFIVKNPVAVGHRVAGRGRPRAHHRRRAVGHGDRRAIRRLRRRRGDAHQSAARRAHDVRARRRSRDHRDSDPGRRRDDHGDARDAACGHAPRSGPAGGALTRDVRNPSEVLSYEQTGRRRAWPNAITAASTSPAASPSPSRSSARS